MPSLIRETVENLDPKGKHGVLQKPYQILFSLLDELGQTAIEVDDPRINCMMLRLGIYEQGVPSHPEFEEAQKYLDEHYKTN